MASDDLLTRVLSEFASTLLTDFPIQKILDHLVLRVVEVLPISSAGVTLIADGTASRYVAASDESALKYEQLQTEFGQGPCLLAYRSNRPVAIPDLAANGQFDRFTPAAVARGLAAVFTFPLRHGVNQLGALDLYRDSPGALSARDLGVAQTLADVIAAYLLNAQARDRALVTSDHLHYEATHDPLTGLANRALLQERLRQAARRATRTHGAAAVLFVDLDRFKLVNDTHGHRVGDDLLVAVAARLSGLIRPGDTIARPSGDEFVFLCEDLQHPGDAEALAVRVSAAFSSPFRVAGKLHQVSASVGIAFAGPGDDISEELLLRADSAMYVAKRRGGAGHQVHDLRPNSAVPDLGDELRQALRRDELSVAYQPIVTGADGNLFGVESLLRWDNGHRGGVTPLVVVATAEQQGFIHELGAWVLQRSCEQHASWAAAHPATTLDLAVNVSALQLRDDGFTDLVLRSLSETGMNPARLILEITETCAMDADDSTLGLLADLRSRGVRIALDDFGTGFSSLSYLSKLRVDIIKIDRSFISQIGENAQARTVVVGVTALAHALDLTVVAEGVESALQAGEVHDIGCDLAQGFHFGPPAEPSVIDGVLAQLESVALSSEQRG